MFKSQTVRSINKIVFFKVSLPENCHFNSLQFIEFLLIKKEKNEKIFDKISKVTIIPTAIKLEGGGSTSPFPYRMLPLRML